MVILLSVMKITIVKFHIYSYFLDVTELRAFIYNKSIKKPFNLLIMTQVRKSNRMIRRTVLENYGLNAGWSWKTLQKLLRHLS